MFDGFGKRKIFFGKDFAVTLTAGQCYGIKYTTPKLFDKESMSNSIENLR